MSERQQQKALVDWLTLMNIPVVHIPNEGKRSLIGGQLLKGIGMYPGASDLFIARPILSKERYFGGYWIEMKDKGKKPTPKQYEFLSRMAKEGYMTGWFDDWIKAKESIERYLDT